MVANHSAQPFSLRYPRRSGTQYFPEARSWPDTSEGNEGGPLPKLIEIGKIKSTIRRAAKPPTVCPVCGGGAMDGEGGEAEAQAIILFPLSFVTWHGNAMRGKERREEERESRSVRLTDGSTRAGAMRAERSTAANNGFPEKNSMMKEERNDAPFGAI
jgi:hypothetical protein